MKRTPLKPRKEPMKRGCFTKPRKPMRRVSAKRAKENREYSKRRKAFLEANPWCEVSGYISDYRRRSVDVHHRSGRNGARLLDESEWMAVSREGHDYIHAHPNEARLRGWLK